MNRSLSDSVGMSGATLGDAANLRMLPADKLLSLEISYRGGTATKATKHPVTESTEPGQEITEKCLSCVASLYAMLSLRVHAGCAPCRVRGSRKVACICPRW